MSQSDQITTKQLTGRPQVAAAVRAVMRYVYEQDLQPGDKIPSQQALRACLGLHNHSLSAAMSLMMQEGVLRRKCGAGTFLLDREKVVRNVWRIGLAMIPKVFTDPYYGQLTYLIHSHLGRQQLSVYDYVRRVDADRSEVSFADFDHLVDDIEDRRIDVLITLSGFLGERPENYPAHVPIVHIGRWEDAPCGVFIDVQPMVRDAVFHFREQGRKRIVLVLYDVGKETGYDAAQRAFNQVTAQVGYSAADLSVHHTQGAEGGRQLAAAILEKPAAERPDALIVLNDVIAMGLVSALAASSGYRPLLAVMTNSCVPYVYTLPILQYELDDERLSIKGIDLAMRMMRLPDSEPRKEAVSPVRHSG